MNSKLIGLRTAGVLFGLFALAQLIRLFVQPNVIVSGYVMPLWPSALAFLILAFMSAWMLKLGRA